MNKDLRLERHGFCFNPRDNGGETLMLTTDIYHNGDSGEKGIYYNQEITLLSYCNSASLNLYGASITPDMLRKLANELESANIKAAQKATEVVAQRKSQEATA